MNIDRATYMRIDTTDAKPYLEGDDASELVVMALINGKEKRGYDLLGFVIMPNELQLLIVPRRISPPKLVEYLEAELYPFLNASKWIPGKIFDADIYLERIDLAEDLRLRQRMIHNTPVKAGLVSSAANYSFSTANPRYQPILTVSI